MAGTGGCESRDEEEVEPMHAWLQTIRMRLEAAELREEAKAEAAEAAAQKAKVQDLTGKLAIMQAQLASKNLQLQEVQRQIMEARREEDPKTAHLRGELRSLSQRNARLEATRKRLVAQLRESEEKREDACASAKGSGDHQDVILPMRRQIWRMRYRSFRRLEPLLKRKQSFQWIAKKGCGGRLLRVTRSSRKPLKTMRPRWNACKAICQVQKDSKRVLNELEEWQRQCDKNDREIKELPTFPSFFSHDSSKVTLDASSKELSRCCERSMQKEKEHKRAAAHLQKEVEKLSEKLLKVQEERQQVVREADRLRWGTFVLVAVSLCTILASVSLRRGLAP
eukprot:g15021.t1